jgi:hypothetical protein
MLKNDVESEILLDDDLLKLRHTNGNIETSENGQYKTPSQPRPVPRQTSNVETADKQERARKRPAEGDVENKNKTPPKKVKSIGATQHHRDADHSDIEPHSNLGFKTPVAVQKKKKSVPVIESSKSDSEGEHPERKIEQKMKAKEKKKNKSQPDNTTQVRQDQLFDLVTNGCPNIETINC